MAELRSNSSNKVGEAGHWMKRKLSLSTTAEEVPKSDAVTLPGLPARPQTTRSRRSSYSTSPSAPMSFVQPASVTAPSTPEQLLRAIQSVEVFESQSDWALVTRPNGGSFWVNRRTGQFKAQAPNSVYRAQTQELKDKQDKITELEAELKSTRVFFGKWKGDREAMDKEDLMPELAEKSAQLLRLEHAHEKLKLELSQTQDLLKQKESELRRRLKQMQSLEEKGLIVDELKAQVGSLTNQRTQLEQQLRSKDFELGQAVSRMQAAEKEAESAKLADRKSQDRVASLIDQLRSEAERSADLDERLTASADAVNSRDRLLAENRRLADAARDAELLTSAARRAQRQLADQLVGARAELERLRALLGELRRLNPNLLGPAGCTDEANGGGAAGGSGDDLQSIGESATVASEFSDQAPTSPSSSYNSFNRSSSGISVRSASATPTTESSSASGSGSGSGAARPSRQLRNQLIGLHIHLGDRVVLQLDKQADQCEAIVKYIGQPEGHKGVRYGVRLLNKRLVPTTQSASSSPADRRWDLLVRASQIFGVFNQKTNSHQTLDSLVSDYLAAARRIDL